MVLPGQRPGQVGGPGEYRWRSEKRDVVASPGPSTKTRASKRKPDKPPAEFIQREQTQTKWPVTSLPSQQLAQAMPGSEPAHDVLLAGKRMRKINKAHRYSAAERALWRQAMLRRFGRYWYAPWWDLTGMTTQTRVVP